MTVLSLTASPRYCTIFPRVQIVKGLLWQRLLMITFSWANFFLDGQHLLT